MKRKTEPIQNTTNTHNAQNIITPEILRTFQTPKTRKAHMCGVCNCEGVL